MLGGLGATTKIRGLLWFWLVLAIALATSTAALARSTQSEIRQGRKLYNEIISKKQIYRDAELHAYIERIGKRLVAVSERPTLKFTFTVIDEPAVNAYALPGGFIFIDRGLLAYLNTEDELAAVLAHEIGHVAARHSIRHQQANQAAKILGATAAIATYWYTGSADLADIPPHLGAAWSSGYGRKMELEADKLGAEYLVHTGYDRNALLDVIGVLKYQSIFQRRLSEFMGKSTPPGYHAVFSTHPQNDKRLYEIITGSKKLPKVVQTAESIGDYLARIDGLLYGPSGAAGFEYDNTYYHGLLNVVVDFPSDWRANNRGAFLLSYPPQGPESAYVLMQTRPLLSHYLKQSHEQYISDQLGIGPLTDSQKLTVNGFQGIVANVPVANSSLLKQRVAVFFGEERVYEFLGALTRPNLEDEWLNAFDKTIYSLRVPRPGEVFQVTQQRVGVYTTKAGDTYESLVPQNRPETEILTDLLRLLNGDYPSGDVGPGERIKRLY